MWPKPLLALLDYWDYLDFGIMPSQDEPGSRLRWQSFRLVHRMYQKWEALRTDTEGEVQLIKGIWDEEEECWLLGVKDPVEDNYIPKPKPPKKPSGNRSRGEDLP